MSQGMKEPNLQISQEGGHLYTLEKAKALKLIPGERHALLRDIGFSDFVHHPDIS
jgi:hypothetical protein